MFPRTVAAVAAAILVSGLASRVAWAQRAEIKAAAAADPRPVAKAVVVYESKQSLGKGVTLARITNGMTVIVQENHSAPVATVRCYVQETNRK